MGCPAHGMTEWRPRNPGCRQESSMSKSSDPSMATPRSGTPVAGRNVSQLLPVEPATKPSIHILVADDERTLRESCASVLGVEGYNVTVTGKGDEALDLLRSEERRVGKEGRTGGGRYGQQKNERRV